MRPLCARLAPPVLGTGAVVAAWWVATTAAGIDPILLPSPAQVAGVFTEQPGYLLDATRTTAVEVVQGYAVAVLLGVPVGALMGSWPALARAVVPSLVGLDAVPKLALAPLLVVWLGFGAAPKVTMVVLTCLLPVVLSTVAGVTGTPIELVELARSLRGSWWRTLVKVRLPQALPRIFTGLRIAAPLAVIGAVIGEFFGAVAGLGYTIRAAGADVPLTFAALLILAGLSLSLFSAVAGAERLLVPWSRHTTA
jgi:NitT/TauT family transport system permease protein